MLSEYYHLGAKDDSGPHTPYVTHEDKLVAFLIRCSVCNRGLCKLIKIVKTPMRNENMIFVEPCPNCMEAARTGTEVVPYEMNGELQTSERF